MEGHGAGGGVRRKTGVVRCLMYIVRDITRIVRHSISYVRH